MRVVVTGSCGRVGRLLVPALREISDVVEVDSSPVAGDHVVLDICDRAGLAEVFSGADAVVHLAAKAPYRSTWKEVSRPNIEGTHSVFEAARLADVRRVVFASSNHVTGMYDREHAWPVSVDLPVRPSGVYGVSKVFGEALGRYYADEFGLSVICLRIGWVRQDPASEAAETGLEVARMMWLSARDLVQLVTRSLQAEVKFGIYYGVSENATRQWNIDNARAELGYQPVDNSADTF